MGLLGLWVITFSSAAGFCEAAALVGVFGVVLGVVKLILDTLLLSL